MFPSEKRQNFGWSGAIANALKEISEMLLAHISATSRAGDLWYTNE